MRMISERPNEADDQSVPGHWEGDLIMGAGTRSAVGTVVERSTRFTVLLHLVGRHDAETLRDALLAALADVPLRLRQPLPGTRGRSTEIR